MFCCFPLSVDVKSEVPVGLEPISPLDLRTDLRMMVPMVDPIMREKQLQQELLLIQQQQQIQKQLLIAEFQKQHENLTRQHQAQLQEHIKVATFFIYPLVYCKLCMFRQTWKGSVPERFAVSARWRVSAYSYVSG